MLLANLLKTFKNSDFEVTKNFFDVRWELVKKKMTFYTMKDKKQKKIATFFNQNSKDKKIILHTETTPSANYTIEEFIQETGKDLNIFYSFCRPLMLANVSITIDEESSKTFEINPLYFVSLLGYTNHYALKNSNLELEFLKSDDFFTSWNYIWRIFFTCLWISLC